MNERTGGWLSYFKDSKPMRDEALYAIQEGRAMPVPSFAVEQGSDLVSVLKAEIARLNSKELDHLRKNVEALKRAVTIEGFDAVRNRLDVLTMKGTVASSIIGYILGELVSPGGGLIGASVTTVGKKLLDSRDAARRLKRAEAKASLLEALIDGINAQSEFESQSDSG